MRYKKFGSTGKDISVLCPVSYKNLTLPTN